MLIKEIMTTDVISVKRSTTFSELLEKFKDFHLFPMVPVIENTGKLVGIVSFRDLISIFTPVKNDIIKRMPFVEQEEADIFNVDLAPEMGKLIVVEDIMDKRFIALEEEMTIEEAFNLMKLHKKDELPVIDKEGNLKGLVGIFDIVCSVFKERGIL
ncbi:MAG: CBS domain-containing protein [Candidatus Schekmanbacteria bacterium]|nr:MAG: CBS domain-containing protein [Candidatus Schekmanbacteria bacterium]